MGTRRHCVGFRRSNKPAMLCATNDRIAQIFDVNHVNHIPYANRIQKQLTSKQGGGGIILVMKISLFGLLASISLCLLVSVLKAGAADPTPTLYNEPDYWNWDPYNDPPVLWFNMSIYAKTTHCSEVCEGGPNVQGYDFYFYQGVSGAPTVTCTWDSQTAQLGSEDRECAEYGFGVTASSKHDEIEALGLTPEKWT